MAPPVDDPATLLHRLKQFYLSRDLERDEIITVMNAVSNHLVPLIDHPQNVLLLGEYTDADGLGLDELEALLNNHYRIDGASEARIFRMNDVPGEDIWINLAIKFRFLADISDHIVGLAKDDKGGFVYEQGVIATEPRYRDRLLLLKQEYPTQETEHAHYSAMQSEGLFDMLEQQGRLFKWKDIVEFIDATAEVYIHMEK